MPVISINRNLKKKWIETNRQSLEDIELFA